MDNEKSNQKLIDLESKIETLEKRNEKTTKEVTNQYESQVKKIEVASKE